MGRLLPLMFLINIALVVAALISCLSAEEGDIRGLPRLWWVLIILLFSPVGPIAWFVAGKERYSRPRSQTWAPGSGFPENQRPDRRPGRTVAPDDNPDFLRGISAGNAQRDKEREDMRKWEEDLRRREDELRKRDNTDS